MLEDLIESSIGFGYEDKDGCFWNTEEDYIYIGVLPSCGCGEPEKIGKYAKDMFIKHVKQTDEENGEKIWKNNSYENLPLMFFLSWADREKYIEHGSTIRCSWMTEKGEKLLKDLIYLENKKNDGISKICQ